MCADEIYNEENSNMRMILYGLVLIFLLSGCAGSTMMTQMEVTRHTRAMINLKIDMTPEKVIEVMGNPNKTEMYRGKNSELILVYLYITEYPSWKRTEANYTPLIFENNKLAGWGWNYLNGTAQKYEFIVKDLY